MKNLNGIKDQNIKLLAGEIYDLIERNFSIFKFEVEGEEVYVQVNRDDSFFFSVDVRGNETEFFLEEYNFYLYDEEGFSFYKSGIICIIDSIIKGNYKLVLHKLGHSTIKTDIVFNNSLEIELYKSLFFPLCNRFLSKKIRTETKSSA